MRSPDVQGGDIGVPWFVGTSWLNKPLAVFFSSFPSPDVRQSRFLENPMDSGQRDSHHTGIDHLPGQSPVANPGMSPLEGQNGRLFFGKKVMTPGAALLLDAQLFPGSEPTGNRSARRDRSTGGPVEGESGPFLSETARFGPRPGSLPSNHGFSQGGPRIFF